jgi:hypothetical protein
VKTQLKVDFRVFDGGSWIPRFFYFVEFISCVFYAIRTKTRHPEPRPEFSRSLGGKTDGPVQAGFSESSTRGVRLGSIPRSVSSACRQANRSKR